MYAANNECPKKVPVIPDWCDYNTYTPTKKMIIVGVARIIISLISLGMCIAFLSIYDSPAGVNVVLSLIIFLNIVHAFITLFFIEAVTTGGPKRSKQWFLTDFFITAIFILLVLVMLFMIPSNKIHILLGIKLILLSGLLCWRYSGFYLQTKEQPLPV